LSLALPERTTVRSLLLDAGGVLVRPNFLRVAEALRAHGVPADPERLAMADGLVKRELDLPPSPGLATDEERGWRHFNRVLEHAGIALSAATDAALLELKGWHDRQNIWEDVPHGVRESLVRFRRAGLQLAVVSNANGTVSLLLERLGLLAAFDAVLDSAIEGVEKPDPRLFLLALARLGADPQDALHVGDLYHVDVVGARAAGLRAVLLDDGGRYPEADCPRIASLAELADHLAPEAGAPILLNSEAAR
jgi:HAD superfamily hydrolase (TIGR01509 family)